MRNILIAAVMLGVLAACNPAPSPSNAPASDSPSVPASESPAASPTDSTPEPTSADEARSAEGILQISEGAVISGPGISISEALAYTGSEPLLVNGALFISGDDEVLLCEAIAESFPPQCGGLRLEVRGLDLTSIGGLQSAEEVRWVEQIQLLGDFVED